jgi:hypothetical protein
MAGEMAEKSKECKGYKDEQEEKSKKWDTKQAAEAVATLEKKKAAILKIQAKQASIVPTPCLVCGEEAKSVCSRCESAWYCGEDCQKKHWKSGHKKECKKNNKD